MSLPYFPMYPSDFEAKTSHLTIAEDGAYNRLLRICWMSPGCSMPLDEVWIMRRVRAHTDDEKDIVRTVLAEFFTAANGRYSNARLTQEWLAANDAHAKRKAAGSKGGKAKSLKDKEKTPSNAQAMPKQPEPEPYTDIKERVTNVTPKKVDAEPDPFEDFWQAYPHRGGAKKGKAAARKAWTRATTAKVDRTEPAEIIAAARAYHADRQVRSGYAKDPATWINQACWLDEIETEEKPNHATKRNSTDGQAHERAQRIVESYLAKQRALGVDYG